MRLFGLIALALALFAAPAYAGPARCFMHGVMVPQLENNEKTSLSDMLRLHFDANDKAKCEQLMEAYCYHNIKGKDYSPAKVSGSFKPDVDKSEETTYHFSDSCKLETDD